MSPEKFALIYMAVVSSAAFFAYGIDKHRAKKGAWRISEKTLLGLGVIGGALGGLLGMKMFHHKTKHRYFWAINILALVAHIAIVVALAVR